MNGVGSGVQVTDYATMILCWYYLKINMLIRTIIHVSLIYMCEYLWIHILLLKSFFGHVAALQQAVNTAADILNTL